MSCQIYERLQGLSLYRGDKKCPHEGSRRCIKTEASCLLGKTLCAINDNSRIVWETPEDLAQDEALRAFEASLK